MRRAAEGKSAALARAQAQLAGRRMVTQRGQGPAGGSVTLSSGSSSSSRHVSARELSDLGGPTAPVGRKECESQSQPAAPPQPRRRFLKQQAPAPREPGPAGPHPAARRSLSTAAASASSPGRSGAVLRKLAQIESTLRSRDLAGPAVSRRRRRQQALSEEEEEEEPSWSGSRRGHSQPRAAGGQERRPQAEAEAEPPPPDPAGGAPERSPSGGAAGSGRLSSPPLLQGRPAAGAAASVSPRGSPPSGRSVVRSLEELFSEEAGSSSSEFRVNVLSLEDLAPSGAGGQEEEEETSRPSQELETSGSPLKAPSAAVGGAASPEEEEEDQDQDQGGGGTEISERLGGSSSAEPPSLGQPMSPVGTEYSDDFESSSVAEDTEDAPPSAEDPPGRAEAPLLRSGPSWPPRPGFPPGGVKDAAVQTGGSWPAAPWGRAEVATAALGQTGGGGGGGGGGPGEAPPVPSSPPVSPAALEALASGSPPARLVLNDILRQSLQLIRHFVEATRHLHASFVASLEEEQFHYHTLEEAQEYIKRHKPRPLTLEQALRELGEQRPPEGQQQGAPAAPWPGTGPPLQCPEGASRHVGHRTGCCRPLEGEASAGDRPGGASGPAAPLELGHRTGQPVLPPPQPPLNKT